MITSTRFDEHASTPAAILLGEQVLRYYKTHTERVSLTGTYNALAYLQIFFDFEFGSDKAPLTFTECLSQIIGNNQVSGLDEREIINMLNPEMLDHFLSSVNVSPIIRLTFSLNLIKIFLTQKLINNQNANLLSLFLLQLEKKVLGKIEALKQVDNKRPRFLIAAEALKILINALSERIGAPETEIDPELGRPGIFYDEEETNRPVPTPDLRREKPGRKPITYDFTDADKNLMLNQIREFRSNLEYFFNESVTVEINKALTKLLDKINLLGNILLKSEMQELNGYINSIKNILKALMISQPAALTAIFSPLRVVYNRLKGLPIIIAEDEKVSWEQTRYAIDLILSNLNTILKSYTGTYGISEGIVSTLTILKQQGGARLKDKNALRLLVQHITIIRRA